MKIVSKIKTLSLSLLSLVLFSSCAVGAATAGYSVKAQTADTLTSEAEQKIVDRTKKEIIAELSANKPIIVNQ